MQLIPTIDEQKWLEIELFNLLNSKAAKYFFNSAIITCDTEEIFKCLTPTISGVVETIKRLLKHIGMDDLDVVVYPFDEEILHVPDRFKFIESESNVPACFLGIESNTCYFAVSMVHINNLSELTGILAHEVSHVYRRINDLEQDENEELLTDLTSVVLGLGILTFKTSYIFYSSSSLYAGRIISEWKTREIGYLTSQAFGYLLAMQLIARNATNRMINFVSDDLEDIQKVYLKESIKSITQDNARLCELQNKFLELSYQHDKINITGITQRRNIKKRFTQSVLFSAIVYVVLGAFTKMDANPFVIMAICSLVFSIWGWYELKSECICCGELLPSPEVKICPSCSFNIIGHFDSIKDFKKEDYKIRSSLTNVEPNSA